jgi:ABC-type transport system substrate-binding protein
MPFPNAADVAAMKQNPDLTVMEQEGLNVAYLAYNTTQPPFDKVEVRKALNMAINKQAIVDAVFQGAAIPAKTRFRRPCGPTTTRCRTTPTIRRRPRRCSPMPA